MDRRNFLRGASLAGMGLSFSAHGLMTDMLSPLTLSFGPSVQVVKDRVLVVIRLFGGVDGLHTVVPLDQYEKYVSIRPKMAHLRPDQANGLINLDSRLLQKIGIHPALTSFKRMYDAGNLHLINSVNYPNNNYSHFGGDILQEAGRDGNNSYRWPEGGMMGRLLNAWYPGLGGNPTDAFQDPLALYLNPYYGGHYHGFSFNNAKAHTEYHTGSLWDYFLKKNAGLRVDANAVIPNPSEYRDLLDYLNLFERKADIYYNNVKARFDAGSNSSVAYPNDWLGHQLKTVARLLKGGSQSKIFHATWGNYDTHVGQAVPDQPWAGHYANVQKHLFDSIEIFLKDLTNLGLADRVMLVTFSEFGRTPYTNNPQGTEHGNINPLFVMGTHIKPGISGTPPDLNQTAASTLQFINQMQFDYRQIYTTLFQDWLGATSDVIAKTELTPFENKKVAIIKEEQIVTTDTRIAEFAKMIACTDYQTTDTEATFVRTDAGWDYYSLPNQATYIFGLEKKPQGTGANTANFTPKIVISQTNCPAYVRFVGAEATLGGKMYFNIQLVGSEKPNGWINIRWFIPQDLTTQLVNFAGNIRSAVIFQQDKLSCEISSLMWLIKKNSALKLINNLREDGRGIVYGAVPMQLGDVGTINNAQYQQFNQIKNDSGSIGGGVFVRVSSESESDVAYQIPAVAAGTVPSEGSLRFNTTTKAFEGYNGSWAPLH